MLWSTPLLPFCWSFRLFLPFLVIGGSFKWSCLWLHYSSLFDDRFPQVSYNMARYFNTLLFDFIDFQGSSVARNRFRLDRVNILRDISLLGRRQVFALSFFVPTSILGCPCSARLHAYTNNFLTCMVACALIRNGKKMELSRINNLSERSCLQELLK